MSPEREAGPGERPDPADLHETRILDLGSRIETLIRERAGDALIEELAELHPSDVADLIFALPEESDRLRVLQALPVELASESLVEMEEGDARAELLAALDPAESAVLLQGLADDDAADLISELEQEEQDRILDALPLREAGELRDLLRYPDDVAGGIMTTGLVAIPQEFTAGRALPEVRRQGRAIEEEFYTVFVVDEGYRLKGAIPLYDLILADPDTPVADLAEVIRVAVSPDTHQEDVGRLFSRYNLASLPVVDGGGRLLGRITFDDVIDVLEEEQTEDYLRLAGTSDDEEIRGGWMDAVRSRLPWLAVNMVTASLGASTVFLFQETVDRVVLLAVLMPVVAGMGGNAATQALAVTVRRIATTDGPLDSGKSAVAKELKVGLLNGLLLGGLAALIALLIPGGNPLLGGVVLLALWGNILMGGFAGAFVPTVLERFGIDPAVASSVFITAFTDFCGFFLLLGLGSRLLH